MASDAQVLVVGAGPTGLTAASELTRHGARVRIVERDDGPSIHSKALVVQPRTLEVFYGMGLADAPASESDLEPERSEGVGTRAGEAEHDPRPTHWREESLALAQQVFHMQIHLPGKSVPMLQFGSVDGPFARPLMLRQSQTERILGAQLERQGVAIEWGKGLVDFTADDEGVDVTLADGERLRVAYLIGCDGSHSLVRKQLGVAFEGSTYRNDFLQVDCKVRWDYPYDGGQGFFTDDGAIICLPLGGQSFRVILIRRERPADAPDEPTLAEFQAAVDADVPGKVELYDPEWMIRFRLHERLAEHFRVGRVFLAGDAAHIHTPAGGQGMNTGIQDAHNLAWKLALVLRGHGGDRLLDSYEAERRPIAAAVLRFTDITFRTGLGANSVIRWLRPIVLPIVLGSRLVQNKATRTIAQLQINVRKSPIVEDRRLLATGLHAGDRAPDARFEREGESLRMFDLLRGTEHVLFAHRAHTDVITKLRRELDPSLVRIVIADEGEELEARYQLGSGSAIWVVRPDGYIGFRQSGDNPEPVLEWFTELFATP